MAKHYEHNCETGEIIETELSPEEIEGAKQLDLIAKQMREEEANKAALKAELLAKLGITAEEAALLLS